jgi:hypothetical protein
MQEQADFYTENGYVVVPHALSAVEVDTVNGTVNQDLADNPSLWKDRGNGRSQNVNLLLAQPDLDFTMRPPGLLPLMETIMGPELCAEEHSAMIRAPNPDGPTECHWHRDNAEKRDWPLRTRYLSVVYYLTDVDESTHTFSVLPKSSQSEELPELAAYDLEAAHHITGPAGTAILFNAALYHAGNVRSTDHERRTIHIYCGHASDQYLSDHTIFPPRLWEGKDESTRRYYSRPNPTTKLLLEKF